MSQNPPHSPAKVSPSKLPEQKDVPPEKSQHLQLEEQKLITAQHDTPAANLLKKKKLERPDIKDLEDEEEEEEEERKVCKSCGKVILLTNKSYTCLRSRCKAVYCKNCFKKTVNAHFACEKCLRPSVLLYTITPLVQEI